MEKECQFCKLSNKDNYLCISNEKCIPTKLPVYCTDEITNCHYKQLQALQAKIEELEETDKKWSELVQKNWKQIAERDFKINELNDKLEKYEQALKGMLKNLKHPSIGTAMCLDVATSLIVEIEKALEE